MGNLLQKFDPGTDLDSAVLNAYISQCTAEAQEGIIFFLKFQFSLLFI